MIRLEASTVLLQWAVGGLLFLWVTTRHRAVGLGYGWLMRAVFAAVAAGGVVAASAIEVVAVREISAVAVVAATLVALAVSVLRKDAGVQGVREEEARKKARVAAMAGGGAAAPPPAAPIDATVREFPPILDLIPPLLGVAGLVAAGWHAADGGNEVLAVARTLVGAAFLGVVTDAMLLGHWYLVQPGLSRKPIHELNDWIMRLWPVEVGLLLVPTGMVSALNGSIDDGWNGMLGWFWVASAITTIALSLVTRAALKERAYSAVMAATGLLYLAILTGFATDLVARAILAG